MPIIPNLFFILSIAITTGYLTFLTTKGGLTDNRFSNLTKRLTPRGWMVFCLLLFMAILLMWQDQNNEAVNNEKDKLLKIERDKRDSTITTGINSGVELNRKQLFETISEAFKKQELRLDTVKKSVEKIRKPSINIYNEYSQVDPILLVDSNGIMKKSADTYSMAFTSYDAGSANFNLKCYILFQYSDKTYSVDKINVFPKGLTIPKNHKWEISFTTDNPNHSTEINLYIKGSYTTLDNIKSYNVDNVYTYNLSSKIVSLVTENRRKEIINIISNSPKMKETKEF